MLRSTWMSRLMVAGAACVLMVSASSARAASDLKKFWFDSADLTQNLDISNNSGSSYSETSAGRYNGHLDFNNNGTEQTTEAVKLFCTDASHSINFGASYDTLVQLGAVTAAAQTGNLDTNNSKYYYRNSITGEGGGLESAMTNTDYQVSTPGTGIAVNLRDSAVAYLVDNVLNAAGLDAAHAAAAQVAMWDLVQDGGDGVTAGTFQARQHGGGFFTASFQALIDGYETSAKAFTGTSLHAVYIQAPKDNADGSGSHVQEFAYYSNTPVPEPAFYQMTALLGLGGLGCLRCFRKKS